MTPRSKPPSWRCATYPRLLFTSWAWDSTRHLDEIDEDDYDGVMRTEAMRTKTGQRLHR